MALGVSTEELVALLAIVEGRAPPEGYEPAAPFDGTHPESLARSRVHLDGRGRAASRSSKSTISCAGSSPARDSRPKRSRSARAPNALQRPAEDRRPKAVSSRSSPKARPSNSPRKKTRPPIRPERASARQSGGSSAPKKPTPRWRSSKAARRSAPPNRKLSSRRSSAPTCEASAGDREARRWRGPRKGRAALRIRARPGASYEVTTLSTSFIVQTSPSALGVGDDGGHDPLTDWFPEPTTQRPLRDLGFPRPDEKRSSTTQPLRSPRQIPIPELFHHLRRARQGRAVHQHLQAPRRTIDWWRERVKGWSEHGVSDGGSTDEAPATPQAAAEGRFYRLSR